MTSAGSMNGIVAGRIVFMKTRRWYEYLNPIFLIMLCLGTFGLLFLMSIEWLSRLSPNASKMIDELIG